MTPPTASPLECLPQVLLEQICEYLSDDSVKRCALWAFSLTSKRCCDAATPRRFCQIQLSVTTANTLMAELGRWNELFGRIDGYRYVRRLKVLGTKRNAPQMPTRQEEKEEEEDLEDEIGWKMRNSFAMHDFCCPSVASMDSTIMFSTKDYPEAYSSLTRFIGRLTTLKDMVWAGGGNIPRPVLSAVHAGGCRLHVRFFRLRSLIQSRDQPQPIDPDD